MCIATPQTASYRQTHFSKGDWKVYTAADLPVRVLFPNESCMFKTHLFKETSVNLIKM
jgi:hypothetical protein